MGTIGRSNKTMTFADIRADLLQSWGVNDPDTKLRPALERSLRRALKSLADAGALLALGGGGGRGDPQRYCINPIMAAVSGSKEQFERSSAILQADPGAHVAADKFMQRMMG
jgi:hypothetical protein